MQKLVVFVLLICIFSFIDHFCFLLLLTSLCSMFGYFSRISSHFWLYVEFFHYSFQKSCHKSYSDYTKHCNLNIVSEIVKPKWNLRSTCSFIVFRWLPLSYSYSCGQIPYLRSFLKERYIYVRSIRPEVFCEKSCS